MPHKSRAASGKRVFALSAGGDWMTLSWYLWHSFQWDFSPSSPVCLFYVASEEVLYLFFEFMAPQGCSVLIMFKISQFVLWLSDLVIDKSLCFFIFIASLANSVYAVLVSPYESLFVILHWQHLKTCFIKTFT